LNGCGKNNAIEFPATKDAGFQVATNKAQMFILIKYPGGLLQFRKINIEAGDFCMGNFGETMG
jgi:hypothetical protein